MRPKLTWNRFCFSAAAAALLALMAGSVAPAAEDALKVEAQLIWGTNDSRSPNPRHKPADPEVRKRLKELPLKWTNYFEENRKKMEVPVGGSHKETLSDKCSLEVKYLGSAKVEVSLIGKGEPVVRRVQDLPRGEMLVLGGNAPNSTSWLVVVKRLD